jgi:hypothetical protein
MSSDKTPLLEILPKFLNMPQRPTHKNIYRSSIIQILMYFLKKAENFGF